MCYIDADGKMQNGTNASGTSYYGIFIVELSDSVAVDKLSLWGSDSWGFEWMSNDGYDIYYSADGESYTAVDGASFENVYAKQSTADALYVAGNYNGKDGYVHDIDMGDVTAKYIAIAVADYVPASDNAEYMEIIFYEIVVTKALIPETGEPDSSEPDNGESDTPVVNEAVKIEVTKFSAFGNHISADGLETPRVSFYASYPAAAAFDGDIGTDAQICNNANKGNLPYEMCFFNPDGVMTNGVNIVSTGKSYYVMFKIKLEGVTSIDTLSLWTTYVDTKNAADRPYMANNGYDIYYSVDGEVYYAVEGASFEDVYAKQSTKDALYVEGTYNEKDGHVHEIDMGGVTAGYIVIAVSDLVAGANEALVSEVVVMGAPVPENNEPDNGGSDNGGSNNSGSNNSGSNNSGSNNSGSNNSGSNNSGSNNSGSNNSGSNNGGTNTAAPETDAAAEGGCGSSIAMTGVVLVGTCAAMLAIKSKKKDEA